MRHNYKNFVALVNPEVINFKTNPLWKIENQEEFEYSKPFGILLLDNKFYYLGEKDPTNFIKLLHLLELRKERFIVIYIQNLNCPGKEPHANIIILDSKQKIGYYFEPHGPILYFLDEKKQKELYGLFILAGYVKFYFPNKYYYVINEEYKNYGFQNFEVLQSAKSAKKDSLESEGYCFYWCMYFLNMIVKHPHIPINTLFKKLYLGLYTLKKQDFHRHIRTYAQRQEKAAKKKFPICSQNFYAGPWYNNQYSDSNNCKKHMFLEYYRIFNYKYGKYKLQ